MYQLGHYGAALVAYAPLGAVVAFTGQAELAILGALLCVSLSTLPDADHQLPLIAHRGPTHTVLFALLVGTVVGAGTYLALEAVGFEGSGVNDIALTGFFAGVGALSIVSHLLADALTPMGIRPFWPLSSRHYTLNVTPAKSRIANYTLFALGVGAVTLAAFVVSTLG